MGLMAMGAAFDFKKAMGKVKPAVTAAFIKLIGFVAIFLPLAAYLGFQQGRADRNPGDAWISNNSE